MVLAVQRAGNPRILPLSLRYVYLQVYPSCCQEASFHKIKICKAQGLARHRYALAGSVEKLPLEAKW